MPTDENPQLDGGELVKESSDYLRGTIADELSDENDFFSKSNVGLLKHHGTYQQDDRDARATNRQQGKKGKEFIFMVRTKLPGGRLTSQQLLAELDLCDELGDTTLRITSRQGLQLHGVVKSDLHAAIERINEVQLTTLGACGDVCRNVMCCPAPLTSAAHKQAQDLAHAVADYFAPKTPAYHEIWLRDPVTGEKELVGGGESVEPIYGKCYLPRKFKMAVGFPDDNCVDLYTHDLGFMAIAENDGVVGYNILVGGGQGTTPSVETTFPAVAEKLCFVEPEQAIALAEAVVKVQRDYGCRTNRKQARLKYLIHDWGMDQFRAKVEEYFGRALTDSRPDDVRGFNDHMGWSEQGDGKWCYGLNVENGRIADGPSRQLKEAVREVCRTYEPGIRLTSHQSILFTDVEAEQREGLVDILRKLNVTPTEDVSAVRRWSMACVAWPTCGLSITESERALPGVIDQLELELEQYGLSSEEFTVRMTGCPNGCARPYNCDIGLVGRAKEKYTVFVGGRILGDRLNFIYKDMVPADEIVATLSPLFAYYRDERTAGETFGDFCHRQGQADLEAWADKFSAAGVDE
jgi:sulfite reductase (ferredoxin)